MKSHKDPFSNIWFPFSYYQDIIDHPPVTVEHGSGAYLYDTKGRGYLDAIGSWWVSILGHNNPEITHAVKDQLDKLEHVLMAGFISQAAVDLAERLIKISPKGLTRVFYSDDGSTAVEAALKMALQYWSLRGENRSQFVALTGAYHGDTLGAMSVGMIPYYHTLFHDRFKKCLFADSPYCYRCPVGKEMHACSAECMDSLESILKEHAHSVAGCIFEPMVQGAAGMRVYPAKVLKRIFHLCKKYGVLTIADEVAMGFGRTGKMFACDHVKETPDIMCVAKGLSGGYLPIAATVVKEEIFEEFCGDCASGKIFHHGHSFTGNPLAAAAGVAALGILERENMPHSLEGKMQHFRRCMEAFADIEAVGDVRVIGLVGAIEFVKDRSTKESFPAESRLGVRIARRALNLGLLVRPLGDVVYFMPNYLMSEDVMDNMFYIARTAILQALNEPAVGTP